MPKVSLPTGIEMAYTERGAGDPLVCIMGVTAPGAVWEAHAAHWEKHFRCVLGDNRGVGDTDKPKGPYTTAMMADDYAALMDHLGIRNARIVGCSLGSVIAQQIALRHPDKVRALVLMCTWARLDRYGLTVWEHLMKCKASFRPEDFMHYVQMLIFTKSFFDKDDCWQSVLEGRAAAATNPAPQPVHAMEAQAAAAMNHDTLKDLKHIKCPALVIGGNDDVFTPRWMSEEVAAALPNADLHLYDNAGHAFHWESLEDFNPRTTKWLLAH
ncbi:MAG: alpha/beta fold hydrolase [Verrucomicrobiales bacterium]